MSLRPDFKKLLLLGILLLPACGAEVRTAHPPSGCNGTTAAIGVFDNFLKNLCGCTETGTVAHPGTSLTCTVSAGTTVFFHYFSSSVPQQIISTDSAFVSSPLSNPRSDARIQSHGVLIDSAGTFPFSDKISPSLSGQIVAI